MKSYLIKQERDSGFFSDFNLILNNLCFFYSNKITNFYFLWKNKRYQTDLNLNLFDVVFFKNNECDTFDCLHEIYDLVNWDLLYNFKLQNEVLAYYNYFSNPLFEKCVSLSKVKNNTIGVHVRRTDHRIHGELLSIDYYFSEIDKKINNYDNIFLATDCEKTVTVFQQKYGSKLFVNDNIIRSVDSSPVHSFDAPEKDKLIVDVMVDAISLSRCEEVLLTQSNVAGYVLAVNPSLPYTFIDKHIKYS